MKTQPEVSAWTETDIFLWNDVWKRLVLSDLVKYLQLW